MTLRSLVAYPFQSHGRESISVNDFVAAVSLDRGWLDPSAAEDCLERALAEGLLERHATGAEDAEGRVRATFEYAAVDVPEDFDPDPALRERRSVFEVAVDRLTDAGAEKRAAVAGINRCQEELGLTLEAAAICYARREGVAVADLASRVRADVLA